jgi:hypothetical protein
MKTEKHVIFIHKGKVYERMKMWTTERIEAVLKRLGATYWEIGFDGHERADINYLMTL